MSLLNQILQQMQAFNEWRTDVINNSKTTEELPANSPFDPDQNIRVSKNGVSKRQSLPELISQIQGTPNGILQISPIELLESPNRVKIPIDPVIPIWRIGGVEYQKNTETILPIDATATGMHRTDIVIAKTDGGFEVKKGTEGAEVSIPYTVQPNELEVTRVNIFEGTVGGQEPAPTGNQYLTKVSQRIRNLVNANPDRLFLNSEFTSWNLTSAHAEGIKGFVGVTSQDAVALTHDGTDIYIKNSTNDPIPLKHQTADATIHTKFFFESGLDYVLTPKEIAHFKIINNRVEIISTTFPKEQQIIGDVVHITGVTGTQDLDLSLGAYFILELTGNTDITFSNLPADDKTFVRTIEVRRAVEETVTLPVYVRPLDGGTDDPTKISLITINCAKLGDVNTFCASFSTIEP